MMAARLPLALLALLTISASMVSAEPVDFNREIRPILSNHCYACHGPDEAQRQGSLRLDRFEDARKGGDSGRAAIVPKDVAHSDMARRIQMHKSGQMPPQEFGKPLSAEQIKTLVRWIEEGAEYRGHWAYIAPKRPSIPAVGGTSQNPIDAFIQYRLATEKLRLSPETDRASLIRRVTFDLIGLPPTPAETAAFVNDPSPQAYERLVDRLLQSPHYGERWAIHWLDLARYADTNGYHIDNHREMWKWRDWVISAFNQNMPFDQFTIEQLAGDLLPNATLEQKIASGFNRNVMVNFEGGADPNEYMTKYVVDRVNTTSTVWLGTTLGCAECHDHKYDPFTQKDFYRFYAFFNNLPERGLDGQKDNPVPFLRLETDSQKRRLKELAIERQDWQTRLDAATARVVLKRDTPMTIEPLAARDYVWIDDALPAGATPQGEFQFVDAPVHSGKKSSTRTAAGLSQHFFTGAVPLLKLGAGDKLFAYVYLDPANPPKEVMFQFNNGSWEHRAYWGDNKIEWGTNQSASRKHMGPLPKVGEWVRLEVGIADVGFKAGDVLNGWAFTQFDGTAHYDTAGIHTKTPQGNGTFDDYASWEASAKANTNDATLKPLQAILKLPFAERKPEQQKQLDTFFIQNAYSLSRVEFAPLFAEQKRITDEEATIRQQTSQVMVMEEMAQPRDTFLLMRGDWQKKGEKVTAGTPGSLPPLPNNVKVDRLALARWLVQPDHPLTARVTVNRFWEQLFGVGLVKTSDDLGSQGEWPANPALLDYLATRYVDSSWDTKALLKNMVMSAAYRQATKVTPDLLARDPENRWLARGPRFRLPAEMIRDHALSVSGLLDGRIGGESVRPYQPVGLWEAIAFGGGFSSQTYVPSKGSDLYRRGLYIYWKRSLPHPSLATFDAPNREVCTDRRPRTNTPLQALVLMNDPIYIEAARNLAQRILVNGGSQPQERFRYAMQLVLSRDPRPEELPILTQLLEQQKARYLANPESAKKLIAIGESIAPTVLDPIELATWTTLSNVLLNLDETITK